MKLLLDENISHRLVPIFVAAFPGTQHVRDLGLKRSPDTYIWKYAIEHDFVIVSKDARFPSTKYSFRIPA